MNKEIELNKENIIKYFEKVVKGYIKHNKYHLESLEDGKAVMYADITEESMNPNGTVHGGLIFGLADTAMGVVATANGNAVATIDSNINYFKPCVGDKIKCVAEAVKVGKTIASYKADIYNSKDELAATVTANYIFLNK